jgi:hypothetical protein
MEKIEGFNGYFDFLRIEYTGEDIKVQLNSQFY